MKIYKALSIGIFMVAALLLWSVKAEAFTRYNTTPRQLAGAAEGRPFIMIDTTLSSAQYKWMARLKMKENHRAGIVFNYQDSLNYCAVVATVKHTHPGDDMRDRRVCSLVLWRVTCGIAKEVDKTEIGKGMNLRGGLNAMAVTVKGDRVTVSAGEHTLEERFSATLPCPTTPVGVGCLVEAGCKAFFERTVVTTPNVLTIKQATEWTRESLDAHFATSKNPYEGYWGYLDRDVEESKLRLGGRYTLALVETPDGYDLIYIDGGQVHRSEWQEGMLKARLQKTAFTDHFTATWIDATFRPITDDVHATFDQGIILTFKFPLYSSQLRLSKE